MLDGANRSCSIRRRSGTIQSLSRLSFFCSVVSVSLSRTLLEDVGRGQDDRAFDACRVELPAKHLAVLLLTRPTLRLRLGCGSQQQARERVRI